VMTRTELKDRIRKGLPMPGVSGALFQEAYAEVLREDYPGSQIVTLLESRSSSGGGGLPAGVHDRVARMLDASRTRREQVRRLDEARSDLKDDAVLNPPPPTADDLSTILRQAGERYKASDHPDIVATRAANLDHRNGSRPRIWTLDTPVSLQEAMDQTRRIPEGLHEAIANALDGGRYDD
jgi:hypothetical protein